MSEWKTKITGDLIAAGKLFIGDGYRAKNNELSQSGFPFARAGNIDNGFHFGNADCVPASYESKISEKISRPGDVVFTSKGTVGRFAYVKSDTPKFVFSPQLCCWHSLASNEINPRFLYYWMHSREFFEQVESLKGQTDMADYVSLSDQRRMKLTLPQYNEQLGIANVLSCLDDKIDLLHRQNKTLEAMAETLFRQWFVEEEGDDWEEVTITDLFDVRDGTHDSPKQCAVGRKLEAVSKPVWIDVFTGM